MDLLVDTELIIEFVDNLCAYSRPTMSTLLSSPLTLRSKHAPGVLRHGVNPTVDDDSRVVGEKVLASAEWLSLSELTYVDQSGQERTWEAVMRVTRAPGSTIDSVVVLALYRRLLHYDCLLLVKQYRPALRAHTIELPSGNHLHSSTRKTFICCTNTAKTKPPFRGMLYV